MGLFRELKRRNVFRVGIAYIVGAWLLAQVADLALDVIGAPDIVLRSVVVILALGFFPAVIFAWAFEMTPEGLKRESDVDRSESITAHTGQKLNVVTIVLLILAVGFVVVERYLPQREPAPSAGPSTLVRAEPATTRAESPTPLPQPGNEKSIAVLPFANRSNQADDLFFTDGIHDDLLTQLAKIHELNVISRTSVMEYRDSPKNLREIGGELNVGTILEGGIQKVGNRVRINAQLIEVATDRHLWAETFDRELTAENIFDIQSEIARKIVQAIAIELTPEEEQQLSEVPTQNLAAYEAYLKSREIFYGANYTRSQEVEALPWLEKAIELDPDYADAYSQLSHIYGQTYWRGLDTSPAFLEKYRATIDRALALNPDSPSALRAEANYHYRVKNDYETSALLLEKALAKAPGDVDLHGDLALSLRRLGKWDESIASFRQALKLDPANRFYHFLMVETLFVEGDWQGVIDNTVALEDATPDDFDSQVYRAVAQMNLTGDLEPLNRVFEKMIPIDSTNYYFFSARRHLMQRDADAAIEVLNNPVWLSLTATNTLPGFREYFLGLAYALKGEFEKERMTYEKALPQLEAVRSSSAQRRALEGMNFAVLLAKLERFDEAIALANEVMNDPVLERDTMMKWQVKKQMAMVVGLTGDHEAAIDLLTRVVEMPASYRITRWDLHYDPAWDFLRADPRFVELATPPIAIRTATQ